MAMTLTTEQAWLQQIQASKLVGICLLDAEGRLIQRLDDDPSLKEVIANWQAERLRQLSLDEQTMSTRQPVRYPVAE